MKEIVIKIPDDLHETIIDPNKWLTPKRVNNLVAAVLHGKVLPKGHGRLIDADAFIGTLDASDRDIYCEQAINEDAPTLVEADKGE